MQSSSVTGLISRTDRQTDRQTFMLYNLIIIMSYVVFFLRLPHRVITCLPLSLAVTLLFFHLTFSDRGLPVCRVLTVAHHDCTTVSPLLYLPRPPSICYDIKKGHQNFMAKNTTLEVKSPTRR